MKLYLMRHGQAENPDIDPACGLSPTGRIEVEQLAQRLAKQGIQLAEVYHSEKARAQQTALIMAKWLAPSITPRQRRGLKPNDDPSMLLPELECLDRDTLLVSHLPFVPTLLTELTGQPASMNFVPGMIVCLENSSGRWQVEWVESP